MTKKGSGGNGSKSDAQKAAERELDGVKKAARDLGDAIKRAEETIKKLSEQ